MQKILIDADTGIDDSIAILYALRCPDVRVVGITTGCGNTDAAQAAENTLRLVKMAGVSYPVPVAIGENKPLGGEWEGPVPHIHGKNGVGDVELAPTEQKPLAEHASDFILRQAREQGRDLTIVTLGRMTNLALALEKEPNLPSMVKNVVFMGGTFRHPGNVTPVSEANLFGDPEAADRVFQAGFDLTMVGLDVTMKSRLTSQHLDLLVKYATPGNEEIAAYIRKAMTGRYYPFNRWQNNCLDHCPVHDPSALLYVTDPSLFTTRKARARVECSGQFTRGMVVADFREYPFDAPYLTICVDVDERRAVEKLIAAFTHQETLL